MRVVVLALALGVAALGSFACANSDPSPCPDCPSASDLLSEFCAATKASVDVGEIHLDMAEKGQLVGQTESEARASLALDQQRLNYTCRGVALAEPSLLTSLCALAGRWEGMEERDMLYAPDVQTQIWINQFGNIVDKYCDPPY